MPIKSLIRTIADFPTPGIQYRDVTTLFKDAQGFNGVIESLAQRYRERPIDVVAGIEARGFILGAALAHNLGKGFVPIRKKGKLPGQTHQVDYALEYGVDSIEIHVDAITAGQRVLLVDDLIATGGTVLGAIALLERSGGAVEECCFIVDLPDLGGSTRLSEQGVKHFALTSFAGH
ncbi:MAG: adenine phosphoribosyltransferase [Pseudomonas sp.]